VTIAEAGGRAYSRAMTDPLDMTLDELRDALAPLLPGQAAFDGWNAKGLASAASALGVPPERARLAFPGGGMEMIDAWFASIDRAMAAKFSPEALAGMKIRDRIIALIEARLEIVGPHREALRPALAMLAMPQNAATGARLAWRAANRMWRLAGDHATDFAHYTKRLTLTAVYGATLLALLDDENADMAETRAFLRRRIDEVMRFEKFKARMKPDPERHFSPARFLGRLRYPVA
jgi:ubiquinone biosynthesis protein COQ9